MIRVKKSMPPPERLSTAGCDDDSVVRQMYADQNGKCYLCETQTTTDFEVEHRHSIAHEGGENDWLNIFLACSYCNGKKGARFDGILNPARYNVEEMIEQKYDAQEKRFIFTALAGDDCATRETIKLLTLIFNGANPTRLKLREEEFRRKFLYEYNGFLERLEQYINSPCANTERPVISDLASTSEYLGFKYHVIMSNPKLAAKFSAVIKWNREYSIEDSARGE